MVFAYPESGLECNDSADFSLSEASFVLLIFLFLKKKAFIDFENALLDKYDSQTIQSSSRCILILQTQACLLVSNSIISYLSNIYPIQNVLSYSSNTRSEKIPMQVQSSLFIHNQDKVLFREILRPHI